MNKYHKIIIILILFISAILILFLFNRNLVLAPEDLSGYKTEEMRINGKIINVEISDTLEKQEKGLSGRQSMPENQGMLFVFDRPDFYSFWMKDMNFSLDFIWIRGDEVVEITRNVKPEDYKPPKSLVPKNKIDKVLEFNAGMAEKMGIKEGNKADFKV